MKQLSGLLEKYHKIKAIMIARHPTLEKHSE